MKVTMSSDHRVVDGAGGAVLEGSPQAARTDRAFRLATFVSSRARSRPAHRRDRLAAFKYPRSVGILDALPRSAAGKI